MSDIKDKEKIIDDSKLDSGVDLKDKKKPRIEKEDRKILKARKKKAIKLKKQRSKKSFFGFSGRISLAFLLIILIFSSILYLFIFLNSQIFELKDEESKAVELINLWEKITGQTDKLLVSTNLSSFRQEWYSYISVFETKLKVLIENQASRLKIGDVKKNPMDYIKELFLNIIIKIVELLNLEEKYNVISILSIEEQETLYKNQLNNLETQWKSVYNELNSINSLINTKTIKNISSDYISVLQKYGELLVYNKVNSDLYNTVDEINNFYTYSNPFASTIKLVTSFIKQDIKARISVLNFLMIVMANIITIVAIFFIIIFFFYLRGTIIKPLNWLIRETERIGHGDLTGKIQVRRTDEIGTLTTAFNTTVTDLKTLVQQINIAIIVITKTLSTLFKSSKDVKESANAQATTIENTRENFEKLDSMIKTITEETTRADNYTGEALSKTELGLQSIEDLEKEMNKIETSSEEITDIIGLINYIAEQTSLLSINASIEAARAGEYGKGFNVVANEIKQLADRSTQSANRIYELITYNSKIIQDGVNLSRKTANFLREIAGSMGSSASIVKIINEESQNIHRSSNEILGVINYIAEVAQVNLIEIENVTNATLDLGDQSVNLQKFIGQFDARSQSIKGNQQHIEDILRNKLEIAEDIIKTLGDSFLPTGNKIEVKTPPNKRYITDELQIGDSIITYNNDFADSISKKTNTSVSFFQKIGRDFVRVSTTVQNYDATRALGTVIKRDSEIYNTINNKEAFYGRIFIVNRWYISVYDPIIDRTGNIVGCMNLAIAEEMEETPEISKEALQEDVIEKKKVLTA